MITNTLFPEPVPVGGGELEDGGTLAELEGPGAGLELADTGADGLGSEVVPLGTPLDDAEEVCDSEADGLTVADGVGPAEVVSEGGGLAVAEPDGDEEAVSDPDGPGNPEGVALGDAADPSVSSNCGGCDPPVRLSQDHRVLLGVLIRKAYVPAPVTTLLTSATA